MSDRTRIAFFTLGCKVNFSETSYLASQFDDDQFAKVSFHSVADFYIVHSCILTTQAEKKTRYAIAKAHRANPEARIIVMGCVSQLKADELKQLPGVTFVAGNETKFQLSEIVSHLILNKEQSPSTDNMHKSPDFHISWSMHDRTRSFLKVQDGCDCYCNYCIVPFARGKSRSASVNQAIEAAQQIAEAGFKEIVLTGINLGDFGKDTHENLSGLLKELCKIDKLERIRISSLEPHHFTDDLFETLAKEKKIMPHYHIPIQAGNNETLMRMGRNSSIADISKICDTLLVNKPTACIAADVITGFPGETDDEFQSSYDFFEKLPLAYMHVFTFSKRDNTKAALMEGQVHPLEKKRRTARLLELSAHKKADFYEKNLNKVHTILPESDNKKGYMYGFTENYIRIKIPFNQSLVNNIIRVKLLKVNHSEGVVEGVCV